jgi:hypothetical protein
VKEEVVAMLALPRLDEKWSLFLRKPDLDFGTWWGWIGEISKVLCGRIAELLDMVI